MQICATFSWDSHYIELISGARCGSHSTGAIIHLLRYAATSAGVLCLGLLLSQQWGLFFQLVASYSGPMSGSGLPSPALYSYSGFVLISRLCTHDWACTHIEALYSQFAFVLSLGFLYFCTHIQALYSYLSLCPSFVLYSIVLQF